MASGARIGVARRPSRLALIAATTMTIAAPVATWWIVGDQSTTTESPDYAVHPFAISPGTGRAIGMAALGIVVLSAIGLGLAVRYRSVDRRWLLVLLPLLATGAICGAGWRVATAGVIGANIGFGMTVIFGGPLCVGLIALSACMLLVLVRSPTSA